jgi:hypothetical protein
MSKWFVAQCYLIFLVIENEGGGGGIILPPSGEKKLKETNDN